MAADRPGRADPAGEGLRASTSTRCSPRSSRHKAGYEEAILLDHRGYVCEGSGENLFIVRDGVIHTPPQTASILDGISRRRSSRSRATSATRSSSATSRAPSSTSPTRSSCAARRPSSCPCARSTTTRSATGEPGEITRVVQRAYDDALHGRSERYAEWLDVVARARARDVITRLRPHPARRHAGRGHVAVGGGEGPRRARCSTISASTRSRPASRPRTPRRPSCSSGSPPSRSRPPTSSRSA